jgi:hypothetical protein
LRGVTQIQRAPGEEEEDLKGGVLLVKKEALMMGKNER